jgi:hypothetical protein
MMAWVSEDDQLRAALFRFVDVRPACRGLDDLRRHLAVPAIVRSAFGFAGQKCSAAARIPVHEAIADRQGRTTSCISSTPAWCARTRCGTDWWCSDGGRRA